MKFNELQSANRTYVLRYHLIYIWLKYLDIYSIYVSLIRQGFRAFLGKSWAKVSYTYALPSDVTATIIDTWAFNAPAKGT